MAGNPKQKITQLATERKFNGPNKFLDFERLIDFIDDPKNTNQGLIGSICLYRNQLLLKNWLILYRWFRFNPPVFGDPFFDLVWKKHSKRHHRNVYHKIHLELLLKDYSKQMVAHLPHNLRSGQTVVSKPKTTAPGLVKPANYQRLTTQNAIAKWTILAKNWEFGKKLLRDSWIIPNVFRNKGIHDSMKNAYQKRLRG